MNINHEGPVADMAKAIGLEEIEGCDSLYHSYDNGTCCFMRFHNASRYTFRGVTELETCPAGGWLLKGEKTTYWIPLLPVTRLLDHDGHILDEQPTVLSGLSIGQDGLTVAFPMAADHVVDMVVWQISSLLHHELLQLAPLETQTYFLWGSHTQYRRPADLYMHLIHGAVYENRKSWPHTWKICSENDAHALFVLMTGLYRGTGKRIYDLFRCQLLSAVLARQAPDGGWYHGEWTGHMESHYRLHTSALHLLLDYYAEQPAPEPLQAVKKGVQFLLGRADKLECGLWFLHDELETSLETNSEAPFGYLESHAFGKSASNMLVLNTHLDTYVAMSRYDELTGDDERIEVALRQASAAADAILAAKPADALYRWAFRAIRLALLPKHIASRLPLPVRALKRLGWAWFIPLLPRLKQRFPRLVMPGGYIDRELSLDVFAHDYLSINVMDLLRYYRRARDESVLDIAIAAIEFGQSVRIWEKWQEQPSKAYAAGFWTEALYHLCLLRPDPQYRQWLWKSAVFLELNGHGFPPSLLGGNNEAIPFSEQVPVPQDIPSHVRAINLSSGGKCEFLFLNVSRESDSILQDIALPCEKVDWSSQPFEKELDSVPIVVPAQGCVRAAGARTIY